MEEGDLPECRETDADDWQPQDPSKLVSSVKKQRGSDLYQVFRGDESYLFSC